MFAAYQIYVPNAICHGSLLQFYPSNKQYRYETFCYGPESCSSYRAGPNRKVAGRKGMSWEKEDWVDEDAPAHRAIDEWVRHLRLSLAVQVYRYPDKFFLLRSSAKTFTLVALGTLRAGFISGLSTLRNTFVAFSCSIVEGTVGKPWHWACSISSSTYLELAECKDSSCRLLRHSKISAPAHSLNWNSLLPRVHCPFGTLSVKSLLDIIYIASHQKPGIACSGLHAKTASHRTYRLFSTWLTLSRPFSWPLNVWH